jgi:hypothetical protein
MYAREEIEERHSSICVYICTQDVENPIKVGTGEWGLGLQYALI